MCIESTNDRSQPGSLASRATTGTLRSGGLALPLAALLALTLALASRAEAYVYWVGEHGDPGTIEQANPTIGRANLDGTDVKQDFVVLPFGGGGGGIAVDDAHVYWANTNEYEPLGIVPSIGRANLDGTAPNHNFIADVAVDYGSGVAVDDKRVYWVSKFGDDSGFKPNSGAIGRANLDGTGVDEGFISGVNFPAGGLAVDASHLYWTGYSPDANPNDPSSSPNRIGRANLDGTGVDESFVTAGGDALAVDDSHVWWADSSRFRGELGRANLDGTGIESVILGEDFFPCGVAVDDAHVYWTGGFSNYPDPSQRIGRAKLDGSRANNDFITGLDPGSCGGLAVDGLGPRPTNEFSFGKAKKNRRKGTAKLTVNLPGSGELQLAKNNKLKGKKKGADAAGKEKLSIKPRGKAKKKLNSTGKAKVTAEVTFTPDGGGPNTESKKIKLVKR